MLKIRFTRVGRKHDPTFRVVVTDSRRPPRSGFCVENLGFCNPRKDDFNLNKEKILYWISKGAKTSDTVHNLLIKAKVIEGKKIDVSKKKKAEPAKEAAAAKPEEKKEVVPEEQKAGLKSEEKPKE